MKPHTRDSVLVIFPAKQKETRETGGGYGGIYKASLSHVEALLAAQVEVTVWTASWLFAEQVKAMGASVDYRGAWHSGIMPFLHPQCWAAAWTVKRRRLIAVLHQGGRGWAWAKFFFPGVAQIGIMHTGGIGKTRNLRYQLALNEEAARSVRAADSARKLKVGLVRNGLTSADIERFGRVAGKQWAHHAPAKIGFLGRFQHMKGVDVLIDAVASLHRRGVPVKLILGGAGSEDYTPQIQKAQLMDHVHFTGWVNDSAVFYEGIDIFCLPSRLEPFGMVLIEAMACALPVVATRTGGPAQIIRHGETGALVPIDSVDALADELEMLLRDEGLRQTRGQTAQRDVLANYSPAAVGQGFIQMFALFDLAAIDTKVL